MKWEDDQKKRREMGMRADFVPTQDSHTAHFHHTTIGEKHMWARSLKQLPKDGHKPHRRDTIHEKQGGRSYSNSQPEHLSVQQLLTYSWSQGGILDLESPNPAHGMKRGFVGHSIHVMNLNASSCLDTR